MGWIGCARCEKLQRDFVAWTFALIAPVQPVLHRVSCVTKRSQMHPNIMKHTKYEFWIQWGGSGALVVKNYNATSWHELLH